MTPSPHLIPQQHKSHFCWSTSVLLLLHILLLLFLLLLATLLLESVSCFVSFSDKFFFLYFIFCFFLLLFYATLCFAINFLGQLLRLRAAARMPHNARHYCLRFLHSVLPRPPPIILPRATSIYGGFAEITLKFAQVNCSCNKKHRSVNGNCAIKIEQKRLQQNI